jgi:hypothetical protein
LQPGLQYQWRRPPQVQLLSRKIRSSRVHQAARRLYSYSKEDTINTYGDARGRSVAANSLRGPSLDTQTLTERHSAADKGALRFCQRVPLVERARNTLGKCMG